MSSEFWFKWKLEVRQIVEYPVVLKKFFSKFNFQFNLDWMALLYKIIS